MVISKNSQLGLRFSNIEVKKEFLLSMQRWHEQEMLNLNLKIEKVKALKDGEESDFDFNSESQLIQKHKDSVLVKDKVELALQNALKGEPAKSVYSKLIEDSDSKYFFICDSVYEAAKLIKVSSGFTGRTLKDIEFGKYTYLMGKNRMVRFVVHIGVIMGFYYDDKNNRLFNFFIELEEGGYDYEEEFEKEFSTVMQILTFVELGDIEVKTLEAGRNNGGKKNVDKVTNTSKNTVYVVDSSWNQLIIRTTGFAVRGHFKLQPCGKGLIDRKLIWVNAFEKHGYTRKPKASIIHV
ncbi:MAG: hypothetical protein NVSMB45_15100 [Ginsengibacter sp.]